LPSFSKLAEEVLKKRPNLAMSDLKQMVDEKVRKVGSGYLTEEGAIFLVAAELGISLEHVAKSDLALSDVYVGASEITVSGRILACYPKKSYKRRDGSMGHYRRIILFDKSSALPVMLWDEKADLMLEPDDLVRVVKAYAKSDIRGHPFLSVGFRGHLEKIDTALDIPRIADLAIDVGEKIEPKPYLVVKGIATLSPRTSSFRRKDGSQGTVTQMELESLKDNTRRRLVLWNNSSLRDDLQVGQAVRVVNVKGRLQPHGEMELHGDESTFIEVIDEKPESKPPRSEEAEQTFTLISMGAVRRGLDNGIRASALVVGADSTCYSLLLRDEHWQVLNSVGVKTVFSCRVRRIAPATLSCESQPQIRTEGYAPAADGLEKKVSELKTDSSPVVVNVMALSRPMVQEITTRDGEIVRRAEVLVGDDTGEIKLVAWRDQTALVEGIKLGQLVQVRGAMVKNNPDGSLSLQTRSYTQIVSK